MDKIKEGIAYAEKQAFSDCPPLMKHIVDQATGDQPVRILDFGCGFGGYSLLYSKLKHVEIIGMDIDPTHIEVANTLKDKHNADNVTFVKRNILDEPLKEDEVFDLVFFNDVIEHIPIQVLTDILMQVSQRISPHGKIFMGYPPWESPYAAHVYWAIKIPWIQYLPEKRIIKLIEKNNQPLVGSLESTLLEAYHGLNRITHKKAMEIVKQTGLKPVLRKSHCILNRLPLMKNVNFGFFPFKYLITYEVLILGNQDAEQIVYDGIATI